MALSGALGGPTLEDYLLARHRTIDALLERAIDEHGVTQVVEVACGLSPRGWRFARRYGDRITYVEADLPEMAAAKREALARAGSLGERHRVEEVDALRDEGPESVAAIAMRLDPDQPAAIVTEGLLGYFETAAVLGMWRRFASALRGFSSGRYLSDVHLEPEMDSVAVRAFRAGLSAFVRGRVHVNFADEATAAAALRDCGFDEAAVHRGDAGTGRGGSGAALIRIAEAALTAP